MKKLLPILIPGLLFVSCAQQQLVNGDKAYARMAYAKATQHYERALVKIDDRAAMLRSADAFRRQQNAVRAAEWYARAAQSAPLTGTDLLHYGQVLSTLGRHDEAAALYESALADSPGDAFAQGLLQGIRDRERFFVDTTLFTVSPIRLDGFTSVFAATPYRGGILFAGEKTAPAGRQNPWTGNSFLDLYTSMPAGTDGWSSAAPLPGDVNGRFHDGPAALSPDGRELYFTRSDYYKFRLNKDDGAVSHLKLFRAELGTDGSWGNIHQFAHNGDNFSTGHAALSKDGNTLYFISDRPGGHGGTDLYRSTRTANGWSAPENLGPTVNTPGDEMFPTVFGDTLFFASNGHPGVGGLDIFLTWPDGQGGWTPPENLTYPINTQYDDFAMVMDADGRSGLLSSNRTGRDHVHRFLVHDPTLVLQGTFFNEETGQPMADVELTLLDQTTGETLTALTGPDGSYRFDLQKDHNYRVSGGKNGMFTESRDLSTVGQRTSRTWTEDFRLKEVVVDKPIVVENIYYDYDRWDIRPDAAVELDKLARIFIDNPNLSFELSSHTDSRASHMYNLLLSEARAKAAVDYLIRRGVDPDRIVARGYGETRLVNHCKDGVECTEEEHQANRRTEFKVTRMKTVNP